MRPRTSRDWMEWVLKLYRAAPLNEPLPEQEQQRWLAEFRDFVSGVGREADSFPELISRFQGGVATPTISQLKEFRAVVEDAVTKILYGGRFVSNSAASPSIEFSPRTDFERSRVPDRLAIELSTMDVSSAAFNRLLSLAIRFHALVKQCPQHEDPGCLGVFLATKSSQQDCDPGCGSRRRMRLKLGIPEERFNKPGRPKKGDSDEA